jgi:NhaC family Na+:H+ antiporter
MLGFNVYVYGDEALSGSNQFVLIVRCCCCLFFFFFKVSFDRMIEEVAENIKATVVILILLMVGALAGT